MNRELALHLFLYNPETGIVTRRVTRSHNARAGDIVGTIDGKGYLHVSVNKRFYRLHRIVFLMHHGWLPHQIDHEDRDKINLRIRNLRPCTETQNKGNSSANRRNTSGFRGVSRNSRSGKWHAQIKIHGKQTYIGRFETPEQAALAYNTAAVIHFGEFAQVNNVSNNL